MLATESIGTSVDQIDLALLLLRSCLGLFLAYHGFNKIFGPNGLSGTAAWFSNIGFKWPAVQARLAATTEIGAGLLLAAGLMTPFAAAGVIGIMIVAITVAHRKVGFFVFLPGQGWEYCATIAVGALTVGTSGPGRWSLDNVVDFSPTGWTSFVITLALGVGAALGQLLIAYRPRHVGGA